MTNQPYQIKLSEYEIKKIRKHERWKRHTVTTLVMRRRLDSIKVVYWSWNLCDDCDWNCHGRVSIETEEAQTDLDLTTKGCATE